MLTIEKLEGFARQNSEPLGQNSGLLERPESRFTQNVANRGKSVCANPRDCLRRQVMLRPEIHMRIQQIDPFPNRFPFILPLAEKDCGNDEEESSESEKCEQKDAEMGALHMLPFMIG